MLSINNKTLSYIFFFFTLLAAFYFGENSSGGSKNDYFITKKFFDAFQESFSNGFYVFTHPTGYQLPSFYFLIGNLINIFGETGAKYLYLIISSLIPLVLYNVLKKKFPNVQEDYLFYLSLLIFLSPYFRSSAVWLTTDNLGLLFFLLSINFFLEIQYSNKNIFRKSLYCFLFLILASYIRQYYAIFFILYFYKISIKQKLFENFFILLFNFICSIPALLYYFIISKNAETSDAFDYIKIDIFFNFLVFTSLFLFYMIPFLLSRKTLNVFFSLLKIKKKIITIIIAIFLLFFLIYNVPLHEFGGGVFYKISKLTYLSLFFFFSLIGALMLYIINKNNLTNNLIYFILVISFPKNIIFQKYYDPLLFILILTLFESKFISNIINEKKLSLVSIYSYFLFFLIFCNIYYIYQ